MILQPIKYNLDALLNSHAAVALTRAGGPGLKELVLLVREAGFGVVVLETSEGDRFVVAIGDAADQSKLVGAARTWSREYGYTFLLRGSGEEISVPATARTYTVASVFTHWAFSDGETIPDGLIAL